MRWNPNLHALIGTLLCGTLAASTVAADAAADRLAEVLAAQAPEVQARYPYRHPAETLAFFGVAPGQTVVEALPGGGWYSRILVEFLGPDGHLIGADYALDMYPLFGFFSEEALEAKTGWVEEWTAGAAAWVEDGAEVSAFHLGSMPEELEGTADAVLFVRALHNLARFEDQGGYLTLALGEAFRVLKPGGVVGVVQHEARPDTPDATAGGSRGYLKKAFVIERMEATGFEFVGESDVNQNERDQPGEEDIVWRLPPSLVGARDDPELKAAMEAIGESNRMTLKFRKPE